MIEFVRIAIVFIAAANPAAALLGAPRLREGERPPGAVGVAVLVTLGVAFGLAVGADRILDWIDIAPETFRVAAGIVLMAAGARTLVFVPAGGETVSSRLKLVAALAFPLLVTPELAAAVVSYGADSGTVKTAGAAAIGLGLAALALGWPRARVGEPVVRGAARLTAAVLVAMAAGLIVSGIRDI